MARTVTARDIVVGTFRLLGVTAQGEQPTGPETQDAFLRLNELVDAWATERFTMTATERVEYALTAAKATYTIGPAAASPDWTATAVPTFVEGVTLLLTSTTPHTELAMGELTDQAYESIKQKTLATVIPTSWYYQATQPLGTMVLWPVPTTSAHKLVLYLPTILRQFADLSTPYTLAPGYVRALRYNLAVELAPEFGRPLDPLILRTASDALAAVKRVNVPMIDLTMDPGITRGRALYNILTDSH